ncbi:hypothetical protein GQ44DRAFT_701142 [Phaeosphaeriaceae sp. PMI808]|nr:hypothetical protein GQ44DRAFT_701142 [Phaeosphaeriaceae sp. PMI808]
MEDTAPEEPNVEHTAPEEPNIEGAAPEDPPIEQYAVGEAAFEEPAITIQEAEMEVYGQTMRPAGYLSDGNLVERQDIDEEICYYVSSRHLTLASPKFERMLAGGRWKEGVRHETDGLYHIDAEDWDKEALLLLLEVLHHRNRRVPRRVSLEMLAKIAVLIDYYNCAEALEAFTEQWIEHLKVDSPVPSHFCRDLMLWMCIAWVLRLPHEFVQATTVAVRRDSDNLSTLGLPVNICVDRIEQIRREAIGTIFSQLQDLLQEYRSPQYFCPSGGSFECGSIHYGALTKELELHGLLPVPVAPFTGLSTPGLCIKLQQIRSPMWWSHPRKGRQHPCSLSGRVMAITDTATRLAYGPELKDFEF